MVGTESAEVPDQTVFGEAERESLRELGTATLHEAARRSGVLPPGIRSITRGLPLVGRALTVCGPAGDNLWSHRAVEAAEPGDVLVIDVSGDYEFGYWGEVLSVAAKARGIAGLIIDGCVRDSGRLTEVGVPVFARGICMRGTTKLPDGLGFVGEPLLWGDATIRTGDVVVGDEDGVLVLAQEDIDDAIEQGYRRVAHEEEIMRALSGGETTMVLYDLPRTLAIANVRQFLPETTVE